MNEFPALTAPGDTGPHVVRLQQVLNALGYTLREDGVYGEGTVAAVKDFQANNGLKPDGWVGKNTLRVLFQSTNSSSPPSGLHEVLLRIRVPSKSAAIWSDPLSQCMQWASIHTPNNKSGFLANLLHESMMLTTFNENLNYSASALLNMWPKRFTKATANRYGRTPDHPADQRAIANIAYGNRHGNRPFPADDGWRYRGRGPIQLTFLNNYAAFSKDTGIDVVANPDLVSRPDVGSTAAAWFWRTRGCDQLAEQERLTELCERINGGRNGLAHRNQLFYEIRKLLPGG
jgi:putative chitinase